MSAEVAGVKKFAGLVPGRHVFYEHSIEGTRAALVADVEDADTGRVVLAVLLKSGAQWINVRMCYPDPSIGGPPAPHEVEGFMTGRWRWMFDGQATALTTSHALDPAPMKAFPESGDPGAPVLEPPTPPQEEKQATK